MSEMNWAWQSLKPWWHPSFYFSKCCVGLDPEGESHEYFGVFLPDAVDKILGLARKLQMKYMKTSNVSEKLFQFYAHENIYCIM